MSFRAKKVRRIYDGPFGAAGKIEPGSNKCYGFLAIDIAVFNEGKSREYAGLLCRNKMDS